MRRFIEAMVGVDGLDIGYGDYDTLFVKLEYDSYYYFFFLKEKEQSLTMWPGWPSSCI